MAEQVGVGLLGLGTVGSVVARSLIEDWSSLTDRCGGVTPVLRHVAVRDLRKQRDVQLPDTVRLGDDPVAVVEDSSVAIVVELLSGIEPAASCVDRALQSGKAVVTANKAVMATRGPQLEATASRASAALWYEACVCAGLPVVATLRDSLQADRISQIDGIVNGTTNLILTRMRNDGVSLHEALIEAQQRGFAEADAGSDIDGWDAAYKLVLLCRLAFDAHVAPRNVDRQGIRGVDLEDLGYAGRLGYTVKLLAHAEAAADMTRVHLRVRPTLIPAGNPLYGVDDDTNMVIVRSDRAGWIALSGVAAGGASTASAVLSDLVHAVRGDPPQGRLVTVAEPELMSDEDVESAGYLRLRISDIPEARELVVQALEDRGVPVVDAVHARAQTDSDPQLIVLTGTAPRAVHDRALETVETLTAVRDISAALDRIEP